MCLIFCWTSYPWIINSDRILCNNAALDSGFISHISSSLELELKLFLTRNLDMDIKQGSLEKILEVMSKLMVIRELLKILSEEDKTK